MIPKDKHIIIAIDGPAASGKSTTAKKVAQILGISYLNTGSMYRALTYFALKNNIPLIDKKRLEELAKSLDFKFYFDGDKEVIIVNNEDISDIIRTPDITRAVSDYCAVSEVRRVLVEKQREYGAKNSCILDGRDIGTVVFPNADFKFFFTASAEERAKRRWKEFKEKNIDITYEKVLEDIKRRDYLDQTREDSPLKKADDAIEVDTTNMTIDEQVKFVVDYVLKQIEK